MSAETNTAAPGMGDLPPMEAPLPTIADAEASINGALSDALKAVNVLSTMLRKANLQGFAVADEIAGSIVHAQKMRSALAAQPAPGVGGLTFDSFRAANVARCVKWHPEGIASWSPSDWLVAVTGELGELASLLKMLNRERDGLPGNKFSPTDKMIADELADVLTYLDLLAAVLDVDLGSAAVSKFNEVSERVGFADRIQIKGVV